LLTICKFILFSFQEFSGRAPEDLSFVCACRQMYMWKSRTALSPTNIRKEISSRLDSLDCTLLELFAPTHLDLHSHSLFRLRSNSTSNLLRYNHFDYGYYIFSVPDTERVDAAQRCLAGNHRRRITVHHTLEYVLTSARETGFKQFILVRCITFTSFVLDVLPLWMAHVKLLV
jgi:hypothetical protein